MTDDTTVPMGGLDTRASLDDEDDDAASAGGGGGARMEDVETKQAGAGMGPFKDFSERRAGSGGERKRAYQGTSRKS